MPQKATSISRIQLFFSFIKLQQGCSSLKNSKLNKCLNAAKQLKQMQYQAANLRLNSVFQLAKQLFSLDRFRVSIMLLLYLITLLTGVFTPKLNLYMIDLVSSDSSQPESSQQISFGKQSEKYSSSSTSLDIYSLILCVFLLTSSKIAKTLIEQITSFLQLKFGHRQFSSMCWHIISRQGFHISGQSLNILQDDLEKLIAFPYVVFNLFFQGTFVIVLGWLLVQSIQEQQTKILIICLMIVMIALACGSGWVIFLANGRFMREKDKRLQCILKRSTANNSDSLQLDDQPGRASSRLQQYRQKQLKWIRRFLLAEVGIRWIIQLGFVLLFILTFMTDDQVQEESQYSSSQYNATEGLYYRLALLGMLRIPFNLLTFCCYNLAIILNSLKRVIRYYHHNQSQSQTHQDHLQNQRQNSITQNGSTAFQQQQTHQKPLKKQHKKQNSKQQQCSSQHIISCSIQKKKIKESSKVQKSNQMPTQKGQIKVKPIILCILNASSKSISRVIVFGLALILIISLFITKLTRLQITSSLISNSLSLSEWIVFLLPLFIPPLLFLGLVLLFTGVSKDMFTKFAKFWESSLLSSSKRRDILQNNPSSKMQNTQTEAASKKIKQLSAPEECTQLTGEQLNRISGDIQAVDKSISVLLYGFINNFLGLIATLGLSVWSIGTRTSTDNTILVRFIQVILLIVFAGLISAAWKTNRYFMRSRRQIKRMECRLKSKIIQKLKIFRKTNNQQYNGVMERETHLSLGSQTISLAFQKKMKKVRMAWKKIYNCQNIGILIENSYVCLLTLIIVSIQVLSVILSSLVPMDASIKKAFLVILFQLDYELSSLFISSVFAEMGLVSFERCLNFVLQKESQTRK